MADPILAAHCLPASDRTHALARMSDCSDCSAHCFFSLLAIVPALAAFLKLSQSLAL